MKETFTKSTTQQTFTINSKEFLTEFIPKLAREYIQMRGAQKILRGTKLKLTLDISGCVYSYIIRNGVNFNVKKGDIDNPHVRISFSMESISKMANMKKSDMLIAMQKQLTWKKLDLLSELSGTSVFQIKNPDDTISEITATFNNVEKPNTILRFSMQDANLIASGRESIFNLLMSGKLKIEGYIAIVVRLQELFVT